jgi:hypothetical protein
VTVLDLSPYDVHPSALLEDLVPPERRQDVWKQLRKDGLDLPPLALSAHMRRLTHATLALKLILAGAWGFNLLALISLVPLSLLTWLVTRPWAIHIRYGPVTVSDAVIYLTPFSDHPGYQWSHEEISTKIRLIIADALDLPLEKVQPETRLVDLSF